MSTESGYSGGTKGANRFPNRDRKQAKRLLQQLTSGQDVNRKQLRRLANTVSRSAAHGTLNARDEKVLGRLLRTIDRTSKPGEVEPGFFGVKERDRLNQTKAYDVLSSVLNSDNYDHLFQGNQGRGVMAPNPTGGRAPGKSQGGPKSRPGAPGGNSRRGRGTGTGQRGMIYYGLGEFPGVSRREARVEVTNENNRLIQELLNQANAYKQDLKFDENKADALYGRTKGDLDYVYGEAQDYIKGRNQAIDQRYANTDDALGRVFSGLQSAMGATTNTNRDAALAEQQRLGIQQTGMGTFDEDANFAQLQAQQLGANADANITMQRNSANEVGNLLHSMAQGALASAVGRATNTRQDSITDARQGYRGNINDIRDDITDVHKNRGQAIKDLHRQMEEAAYQRWAEGQQMDFQNQLSANQFNLDVSKLNSDNFWKRAAHRSQLAEARKRRQLALAEMEANRVANSLASASNNLISGMFG